MLHLKLDKQSAAHLRWQPPLTVGTKYAWS
jgi:hypothetical protein